MRGPRTPFSPERERTIVTPPEVNPERHAQLAGAMEERRGATSGRPTWGASQLRTVGAHPEGFVDDNDAGIVTSSTTDGAHQSTPCGVQDNEGAHRSRERVRWLPVEMHADGAPPGAHNASNSRNTLDVIIVAGATRQRMTAVQRCVVDNASDRAPLTVWVHSSRSGHNKFPELCIVQRMK